MSGFDGLVEWMYSDGNLLMFGCRILTFVIALETMAYIVSILVMAAKTALR